MQQPAPESQEGNVPQVPSASPWAQLAGGLGNNSQTAKQNESGWNYLGSTQQQPHPSAFHAPVPRPRDQPAVSVQSYFMPVQQEVPQAEQQQPPQGDFLNSFLPTGMYYGGVFRTIHIPEF